MYTIVRYTWRVNGVVVANTAVLDYEFVNQGLYIVELEMEDDDGNISSKRIDICVASPKTLRYHWDVDGGHYTTKSVYHLFTTVGIKNVSLTIEDNEDSVSRSVEVYLHNIFYISFGDGQSSSGKEIVDHTYTNAGRFIARLWSHTTELDSETIEVIRAVPYLVVWAWHLKKILVQEQSGITFESNAMRLLPALDCNFKSRVDSVRAEVSGSLFGHSPEQVAIYSEGTITTNLDESLLLWLLQHVMTPNVKMSLLIGDKQFANVFIRSLILHGRVKQALTCELDLLGITQEAVSTSIPNHTTHGAELSFCNLSVALSDLLQLISFKMQITTGYEKQFANSKYSLTPQYCAISPKVEGEFTVARHADDSILDLFQSELSISMGSITIYSPDVRLLAQLDNDKQTVNFKTNRNNLVISQV